MTHTDSPLSVRLPERDAGAPRHSRLPPPMPVCPLAYPLRHVPVSLLPRKSHWSWVRRIQSNGLMSD